MQTVWTFLVYFWLLGGGGLRTSRPNPPCVRACKLC